MMFSPMMNSFSSMQPTPRYCCGPENPCYFHLRQWWRKTKSTNGGSNYKRQFPFCSDNNRNSQFPSYEYNRTNIPMEPMPQGISTLPVPVNSTLKRPGSKEEIDSVPVKRPRIETPEATSTKAFPDYSTVYTTIRSNAQGLQYKKDFKGCYGEYRDLLAAYVELKKQISSIEEKMQQRDINNQGYEDTLTPLLLDYADKTESLKRISPRLFDLQTRLARIKQVVKDYRESMKK